MRTDLKVDQTQGVERRRLDNRHILRRFQRGPRDNRTGARSQVRHSFRHAASDRLQQIKVVKRFQQSKGIAAADEEEFGLCDSPLKVSGFVDRVQFVAHRRQAPASHRGISVSVKHCIRREQHTANGSQKIPDLCFRVIEITAAIQR